MGIFIQPSAAAGFASLMGYIRAGLGATLDLPEGQVNIGGNGKGFLLDKKTNWNPLATGNRDGTLTALTLGDNWYIYAVADPSGIAKWLASKNATFPTGYDATNSRRMGGCHIGRIRGVANRYSTSYAPVVGIVPNSIWDMFHRPKSDPTGMVEVIPGALWADIYLNSEGPGVWPNNVPVSAYGKIPIRDNVYARVDFYRLARNAGKRLPSPGEWMILADGSPQGADGNNDLAWSKTTNTGPAATGSVAKAVGELNIVDAAGNLYELLDSHYDLNVGIYAWLTNTVNVGKDAAIPRGKTHTTADIGQSGWRTWLGGGDYTIGDRCGARYLGSDGSPWNASGRVGLRCVSDAL